MSKSKKKPSILSLLSLEVLKRIRIEKKLERIRQGIG